ncbi:MAG: polyribonucleotide nucleotidyltransferase [Trueperaceae bacterium]|nr:polyribonucleotide nucleotidyltransferase [Trueperaceae bacterium]
MDIPEGKRYTLPLGGRELSIETGKYAKQASGSVTVRYGNTLLLVTAQMSPKAGSAGFLPLTVEYEERHYAIGRIPGSFARREGRPGEKAILSARITDRQIRPLFPKTLRNEIQVIITVLSADQVNDPAPLAAIGASAALSMSDIPWAGPTACVEVGYIGGEYVLNPTLQQKEEAKLELTVAGSRDAVLMVEGGANELSEEVMIGAIEFAHEEIKRIVAVIDDLKQDLGKDKADFEPAVEISAEDVDDLYHAARAEGLKEILLIPGKQERAEARKALRDRLIEARVPDPDADGASTRIDELKGAFEQASTRESRRMLIEENRRSDGRGPGDIRPIWIESGVIPQAHGSAVFTRGETQVLSVATLGSGRDNRLVDDLGLESSEEFMLHYNFPPFSTGEAKRMGGTSRREIGHGNLARRALRPVLPSQQSFPYVIRVVGETLESNGSSSMATVCGSSLSLMDAGVPLRKPVAGIAMGLIKESDDYRVLSDILGSEDALGDMDFKVTGTRDGITALQMDIKIMGITPAIMREALEQARSGRLHILGLMDEVLSEPREQLSERAPRILTTKIPADKIGTVIGPGGKQIRELEAMGAQIEISEDGNIRIFSDDADAAQRVKDQIDGLVETAEIGKTYQGRVAKIVDFGAFVTILPGTDGLLHISQIAAERVEDVSEYLSVGDIVPVKVRNIDNRGKIDLIRPELEGQVAERRSGGGRR